MNKLRTTFILFLIFNSFFSNSQTDNKIKLAIDPLHGGFDEGFFDQRTNTHEKDITLSVSKKIIEILETYEQYEIIKLRTSDVFVPMSDKIIMASELKANLYIAINCQTDADNSKRGTQLFTFNKNKDEEAINFAKKENEVIKKEKGSDVIYNDYKQNDPNAILESINLNKKYLQLSKDFTSILRNELNEKRKFNDNGVIEGPFLMLHNVYMPSAIINIGYLSNPEDLEYLKTDLGQQIIAEAIVNSIISFKNKLDNEKFDLDKFLKPDSTDSKVSYSNISSDNELLLKKLEAEKLEKENLAKVKLEKEKANQNAKEIAEKNKVTKTKKDAVKRDLGTDTDSKYSSSKYYGSGELVYRVQVLACYKCPSVKRFLLNKYPNVIKIHEEGYKKYFIFESLNIEEAKSELIKIRELGFNDAFLIGYRGKEKVNVE